MRQWLGFCEPQHLALLPVLLRNIQRRCPDGGLNTSFVRFYPSPRRTENPRVRYQIGQKSLQSPTVGAIEYPRAGCELLLSRFNECVPEHGISKGNGGA